MVESDSKNVAFYKPVTATFKYGLGILLRFSNETFFCDFPTLWCYIWNYSDLHKFRIFFIIHSWNILVNREVACWEILTLFQMTCFTLNRWQLLNRILLKWNVSSLSRSLFGVVNSWCEILENVLTNAVWFIIKCPLGKFDLKNKTKLTEYYRPPCLKNQPRCLILNFLINLHIVE